MNKIFLIIRIVNIVLSFLYQSTELQDLIKELAGEKKKSTAKIKNLNSDDSELQ